MEWAHQRCARPLPVGARQVDTDSCNRIEAWRKMPENDLILGDIRVLDLSEDVAGPFCTKLLAGLGAEVIKIEPPGTGDVTRRTGPFVHEVPHAEQSAAFLYLNTGKKSLTLDIQSQTGVGLVR